MDFCIVILTLYCYIEAIEIHNGDSVFELHIFGNQVNVIAKTIIAFNRPQHPVDSREQQQLSLKEL